MHKYLRSVGFSSCIKKRQEEELIRNLLETPDAIRQLQIDEETNLCEIRIDAAPGIGIAVIGEFDGQGKFCTEYYYPYLIGSQVSSSAECSIQRHAERETYAGLLDEYRVGISLIFYINNAMEYRERMINKQKSDAVSVNLSGLSVLGKILLPIQKTKKQKNKEIVEYKDRHRLIEAAKNGDEDAIETLTIEDIDIYSQISRRIMQEDIYTIIDSCFMPCGVECDHYAVVGEIIEMNLKENRITGEEVYDFTLSCNYMTFHVGILKKDLIGEAKVGRRFKGQIWMQGLINFKQENHALDIK